MKRNKNNIQNNERAFQTEWLRHVAAMDVDELYEELGTRRGGLTPEEIEASLEAHGRNEIALGHSDSILWRILRALGDPFELILIVIAGISFVTDVVLAAPGKADPATPLIISV
ncbi:MAG: magnesium-transporting ATPase, partial [Atopobiaceae bacterium]|nr:magnesium-transporting ATPase [Atopobiaceae bacterium]